MTSSMLPSLLAHMPHYYLYFSSDGFLCDYNGHLPLHLFMGSQHKQHEAYKGKHFSELFSSTITQHNTTANTNNSGSTSSPSLLYVSIQTSLKHGYICCEKSYIHHASFNQQIPINFSIYPINNQDNSDTSVKSDVSAVVSPSGILLYIEDLILSSTHLVESQRRRIFGDSSNKSNKNNNNINTSINNDDEVKEKEKDQSRSKNPTTQLNIPLLNVSINTPNAPPSNIPANFIRFLNYLYTLQSKSAEPSERQYLNEVLAYFIYYHRLDSVYDSFSDPKNPVAAHIRYWLINDVQHYRTGIENNQQFNTARDRLLDSHETRRHKHKTSIRVTSQSSTSRTPSPHAIIPNNNSVNSARRIKLNINSPRNAAQTNNMQATVNNNNNATNNSASSTLSPSLHSFTFPSAPRTKSPAVNNNDTIKSPRKKNTTSALFNHINTTSSSSSSSSSSPLQLPSVFNIRSQQQHHLSHSFPSINNALSNGDFTIADTFVEQTSIMPNSSSSFQHYSSNPVTVAAVLGRKPEHDLLSGPSSSRKMSASAAKIQRFIDEGTQTDEFPELNAIGSITAPSTHDVSTVSPSLPPPLPIPISDQAQSPDVNAISAIASSIPHFVSHSGMVSYEHTHSRLVELNHPDVALACYSTSSDSMPLDNKVHADTKKTVSLTHLSPDLVPAFCQSLSDLYDNLENWENFDIFVLHEITSGWPLSFLFMMINKKHRFLEQAGIDLSTAFHFIQEVECNYLNNPYHTATHAADVLHGAYHLVQLTPALRGLSALDAFVLYVSCAIHDFQHPGVNNSFLVNSRAPLAIRYNDRSVLESFHVSGAFRMMIQKEHCNILKGFTFQQYSKIRKSLIDLVLSTDLAVHFELMGLFKRKIAPAQPLPVAQAAAASVSPPARSTPTSNASATPVPAPAPSLDIAIDEDKAMIMQIVLKCGDLSHPTRPRRLHLKWSELVTEEFFQQGDRERLLSLPPSMFMDRHSTNLAQSQIGFITFLVLPMFQSYATYSGCDFWSRKVQENLEWWHAVAKQEEEKKREAEAQERDADEGDIDDEADGEGDEGSEAASSEPVSGRHGNQTPIVDTDSPHQSRRGSLDMSKIQPKSRVNLRRQSMNETHTPPVEREVDTPSHEVHHHNKLHISTHDTSTAPTPEALDPSTILHSKPLLQVKTSMNSSTLTSPLSTITRLSRSSSRATRTVRARNRRSLTTQDDESMNNEAIQVAALSAAGASAVEAKESQIEDVELDNENALHAEAAVAQHNQASLSTAGISSGSQGSKTQISSLLTVATLASSLRRKSLKPNVPSASPVPASSSSTSIYQSSSSARSTMQTGTSSTNNSPRIGAFHRLQDDQPPFTRTSSLTQVDRDRNVFHSPLRRAADSPVPVSPNGSPLTQTHELSSHSSLGQYSTVHDRVRKMASVVPIASESTVSSPTTSSSVLSPAAVPAFSATAHALLTHQLGNEQQQQTNNANNNNPSN